MSKETHGSDIVAKLEAFEGGIAAKLVEFLLENQGFPFTPEECLENRILEMVRNTNIPESKLKPIITHYWRQSRDRILRRLREAA